MHMPKTIFKMILSVLFLVLWSAVSTAANDECEKARELYDQAKNLLNYGERCDLFLQAVKLCPSYGEAHVNLADAYENLGEFENAEAHYQEAISLRPELSIPYIGLGEVYLKTGRYHLAQEAFQKGLEINRDDDRLQAGVKVTSERLAREKKFYEGEQIRSCLVADEEFQLMCMCPGDNYTFLRKWICIPPILFESGSVALTRAGKRQLGEIGKALKSEGLKGGKWLIVGHADSIGTPERNLRYSQGRIATVTKYLVNNCGIDPKSFTGKVFGQKRPRATNATVEGRAENRRVEIVVDE